MKLFTVSVMFFVSFGLGMLVAHYSMPEKGRLTEEGARNLLERKWHGSGYLHNEGVK